MYTYNIDSETHALEESEGDLKVPVAVSAAAGASLSAGAVRQHTSAYVSIRQHTSAAVLGTAASIDFPATCCSTPIVRVMLLSIIRKVSVKYQ